MVPWGMGYPAGTRCSAIVKIPRRLFYTCGLCRPHPNSPRNEIAQNRNLTDKVC